MTKQEYFKWFEQRNAKKLATTKAKNADYTGSGDDPFANFTSSELVAGVTTEQGFLVRMGDKMARIKSFVQKGVLEVKDESVDDTLLDLSVYCDLLAAYIASRRANRVPPQAAAPRYSAPAGTYEVVEFTAPDITPAQRRNDWVAP